MTYKSSKVFLSLTVVLKPSIMACYRKFLFVVTLCSAVLAQDNDKNFSIEFIPTLAENVPSVQGSQQDCNASNCPSSLLLDVKSNDENNEPVLAENSDFLRIVNFPENREDQPPLPYPTFASVPQTNFVCPLQYGYYADEEAACQVFHICHGSYKFSFLCPNETVFNQQYFVCDHWANVDCRLSKSFYQLNAQIGLIPQPLPLFNEVELASRSANEQKITDEAVIVPYTRPAILPGFIEPKPVGLANENAKETLKSTFELSEEDLSAVQQVKEESVISGMNESTTIVEPTVVDEAVPETIPGRHLVDEEVQYSIPTTTEKDEVETTTLSEIANLPLPRK